ncbi:DNA mismatch repair protein MutS [candidate division KSB1 bacterium]|nr:DNA mismatch repair protein MutS [candidate division KSB1 bacterium]
MEQYLAIKAKHKNAILFYRMGDFYEMFYDDAKVASGVLGITLTSRAHGKSAKVPLAGFPYHALDNYLTKMIRAGYRVAICEQVEDPKKTKTIVKRDVIEIVTPGTTFSDELLESKRNNYLAAVFVKNDICAVAGADVTTGEFFVSEFPKENLREQVLSLNPAEIIVSETQQNYVSREIESDLNSFITPQEDWIFSRDYGYEVLIEHFQTASLKGFGCEDLDTGIAAAGAVLNYLKENQKNRLQHFTQLRRRYDSDFMTIDPTTQRNLELIEPLSRRDNRGVLLAVLDQTKTAMGGRRLVNWLLNPLNQVSEINLRLDAVDEFLNNEISKRELREILSKIGDLERLLSKITTGRANARDLISLKSALNQVPKIKLELKERESKYAVHIRKNLLELKNVVEEIEKAIVDDPPLAVSEGGLIRRGYNADLDHLREISFSGKDWIAQLQKTERERTAIPSLKVNFNKVFGYYIEITKPHLAKVPDDYIRKQTLVNAERFITPELKEYEEQVLNAEEKIVELEYQLFDEVRQLVSKEVRAIQENASLIGELDCLLNFAQIALDNNYTKPVIGTSEKIIIKDSRHPVVEKLLPPGESFVPNDIYLNNETDQILIITGPNMAGKSTYLRQVGLVVLMAQTGCFVPAKSAEIGLVDKIFTRVGASDNLAGGESTFLMEMNETANILNNTTPKSLILLDEIGRGTSTFDGLSIAWSVAEYLHNQLSVAAKTLFATHYHELTELALMLPRVKNYNVAVKEWGDKVIFLRKIVEGGCDHSYGIQVAQLAGLPAKVINRAKEVLTNLEADELTANDMPRLARPLNGLKIETKTDQLDFFQKQEQQLRDELNEIDINTLTPLDALNKLSELKKIIEENNK